MIEVCTAVRDECGNYAKYVAAMLASVLANTEAMVRIHVLTDCTLSIASREKICQTVSQWHGKVIFYDLSETGTSMSVDEQALQRFTIATMYRLKLTEVLPQKIDRLIYLDADIIANIDLQELWETNLENLFVGACVEKVVPPKRKFVCRAGLISGEEYINAGVMLMDLGRIRTKHNMYSECIEFLRQFPEANYFDQDAINYVFRGNIKLLEDKWNSYAVEMRRQKLPEQKRIYHFIADSPRDSQNYAPDRLFLRYLRLTPWGTEAEIVTHFERRLEQKDKKLQKACNMVRIFAGYHDKRHVFWGGGGEIHATIMKHFSIREGDFFVDNNPSLWDKPFEGSIMHSPVVLQEMQGQVLIVVTIFRYQEVRSQLEAWGYRENQDFFDGGLLLTDKEMATCIGKRDSDWDA